MIPFLLSLPAHHQIPPQDEMGALLLRARTTRNASKWEESIQAYDAMLLKDPFHETALVERATTLSWAKRYDESIAAWRVVKEKVPNRSREAEDNIAKVAAWSRQFALALETLAPYVREGQRQAVLDSATYLSWDRRYPESLERIGGWLKAHPDDTDALLIQARILSWSGQLAASRSAYERLLKLHPGHPDALGGLARVSVWSGDAAGARVYVDQLPAEELKKPENQTLLAQVELAEGHRSRAKARLRPLAAVGSSVRADAEELLRAAAQAQGPSAELFQARTDSNEGLTFQDTGALARVPLGDGSLELGGLRHRSEFNGLESTVNETSLGLAYPLGSVRVSGGVQHFTGFEGDAANGHRLALT
jgi:tetratricopeptide (TPR) repeat protein